MAERLAGKVILVTGGTSGIGEAVVRRVVAEGAAVVVGARRADIGRTLVGRLRAGGGEAVFVPADVSVEADAEALVAAAVAEFGRLDGAVNNAGSVTASGPVHCIDAADWAADLGGNLNSVFYGVNTRYLRCWPPVVVPSSTTPRSQPTSASRGCLPTWRPSTASSG